MKLSKGNEDTSLKELASTDVQVARFVTFELPAEAPQIIDLKAMRRNIRPQPARIYTHHFRVPHLQADLNNSEIRLQRSFEDLRSPRETGTPLRRNPQQVYVFKATSTRSTTAVIDDVMDNADYERLDDEDSDLDWSLLDLPENVYARLANDSRHSLI